VVFTPVKVKELYRRANATPARDLEARIIQSHRQQVTFRILVGASPCVFAAGNCALAQRVKGNERGPAWLLSPATSIELAFLAAYVRGNSNHGANMGSYFSLDVQNEVPPAMCSSIPEQGAPGGATVAQRIGGSSPKPDGAKHGSLAGCGARRPSTSMSTSHAAARPPTAPPRGQPPGGVTCLRGRLAPCARSRRAAGQPRD